jgi:hypothetical protein
MTVAPIDRECVIVDRKGDATGQMRQLTFTNVINIILPIRITPHVLCQPNPALQLFLQYIALVEEQDELDVG